MRLDNRFVLGNTPVIYWRPNWALLLPRNKKQILGLRINRAKSLSMLSSHGAMKLECKGHPLNLDYWRVNAKHRNNQFHRLQAK